MQPPPYGQPPPAPGGYGVPYPPAPGQPKRSWLSRHAGLALGLGCFGLLFLVTVFVAGIFAVVTTALRSSDAYSVALSTASSDATVLAELGKPLNPGWFVSGSINVSGSSGHADISIPVSGSLRSGTIHAVADKGAGAWAFSALNVAIDGRPTIDLLAKLPTR